MGVNDSENRTINRTAFRLRSPTRENNTDETHQQRAHLTTPFVK